MTPTGIKALKTILNGGAVRVDGTLYKFDYEKNRITFFIDDDGKWMISDHTIETFMDSIDYANKWAIIE